jgi:hypothetical protein
LLAAGRELGPDPELTQALAAATGIGERGRVRSVDIVTDTTAAGDGAAALDLASAAFAATCARDGIACAEALVVARSSGGSELGPEPLHEALISLGTRAAAALSAVGQAS